MSYDISFLEPSLLRWAPLDYLRKEQAEIAPKTDGDPRFPFEPLSEGTKKQRSEWKKHSKLFHGWAKKLDVPEAGFFQRFRSATTLPQDTFSQYLKTERARMNVLSSSADLDAHLVALNTSLEDLTAVLTSGNLDSESKRLPGTLLTGIHEDCASTFNQTV